jgi:AcrR family transcriptional regulator
MPNPPTPKGQSSHQAIIDAAYQLFLEKGYHATSIRDISRRSGLTIGGVYTHFAEKGEIFSAVMDEYHPFLQVLPAMQAAQGDTVEELAHDMARRMLAALGDQRESLNLIFIEVVEFRGRHFSRIFPSLFPQLLEIIARIAPPDGSLRPFPMPVIARSFFGLFISFFMTSVALADVMPSDDQTLHDFVDIYLHGVLSPAPAAPIESSTAQPDGTGMDDPASSER